MKDRPHEAKAVEARLDDAKKADAAKRAAEEAKLAEEAKAKKAAEEAAAVPAEEAPKKGSVTTGWDVPEVPGDDDKEKKS